MESINPLPAVMKCRHCVDAESRNEIQRNYWKRKDACTLLM